MTDDELVAQLARELETHEAPLTLVLRSTHALHLAGMLQLVLRHPNISESNATAATMVIEHVRAYFRDVGAVAVLEVLRRGDGPIQ